MINTLPYRELPDVLPAQQVRLRSFEVGEAQVRPPWGVRQPPGGWDVHFYVLQGAPCRFIADHGETIVLRKLSICMINDRRGHAFQDDLCSRIDQLALPVPLGRVPCFRSKEYGGVSGTPTSSFYIGGALDRCGLAASDLPPQIVLEFDQSPDWLFASVGLIKQQMAREGADFGAAARLCEFMIAKTLQAHRAQTAQQSTGSPSWPMMDQRLRRVLALIDGDIAGAWTLAELAEAGGMSRSRLTAHWQSEMGISIFSYIARRRLDRGAELLATTRLDIAAIGRRVGYRSHAAFSTAFRRAFDQSPAQCRAVSR